MKASLDTNAIIHFYKAGLQNILFEFFDDGVFIYAQIRDIELENHGQSILKLVDADIEAERIKLYTDEILKDLHVYQIFEFNVKENRHLYGSGDLGEVYAISLAQTLGAYSLLTDDTKQGGPYMSLLQLDDADIMPLTFADVLILRYLIGTVDSNQTLRDFNAINSASEMNWSFKSQIGKFVRRFFKDPYRDDEQLWMKKLTQDYEIDVKTKLNQLVQELLDNIHIMV